LATTKINFEGIKYWLVMYFSCLKILTVSFNIIELVRLNEKERGRREGRRMEGGRGGGREKKKEGEGEERERRMGMKGRE
jgi:hypothetical protein